MQFTAVVTTFISIHAPLAGSDAEDSLGRRHYVYFNPRSPCGERLHSFRKSARISPISIHAPLAGSDAALHPGYPLTHNFNPRSPCGERLDFFAANKKRPHISIHAPLAGSDPTYEQLTAYRRFQSTLPLRGATRARTWTAPGA